MDDRDEGMCWREDADEMECWWCLMMVLVKRNIQREMIEKERERMKIVKRPTMGEGVSGMWFGRG